MEIKNINRNYNDDYELVVSANIDGIQFNNIMHEDDGIAIDAPIIRKNNNWKSDNKPYRPVVNAVDIDWNNAYIESLDTYINSTGDLIKQIQIINESIINLQQGNINLGPIQEQIDDISEVLSNKANKNEIPNSVYQLSGIDSYALQDWVIEQLRTYQKSAWDVYVEVERENGNYHPLEKAEWLETLKGQNGTNGKSAYEIARQYQEYVNEQEWIASLKGEKGEQGPKGDMGPAINILGYYSTLNELFEATNDTINGIGDAYNVNGEIYIYNNLYNPNNDSIDNKWKWSGQFKGDKGDTGESAFEIYQKLERLAGNTPYENEADWIASLKGEKGDKGDQADNITDVYQIYVNLQESLGNEPLSPEEWVTSLGNGQYVAGNGININNNVISVNWKDANELWSIIN